MSNRSSEIDPNSPEHATWVANGVVVENEHQHWQAGGDGTDEPLGVQGTTSIPPLEELIAA